MCIRDRDNTGKIQMGAQQQKELEQMSVMSQIVPVSVPVPINSGGGGGGSSPAQVFVPIHPAIHK